MTTMTKTAAAALLALCATLTPAFAQCGHDSQQAMTCAEGTVFDADTNSCVKMTG